MSKAYYVAYFFKAKDGSQGFASAYLDASGSVTRVMDMKAMIESLKGDDFDDVIIFNITELTQ